MTLIMTTMLTQNLKLRHYNNLIHNYLDEVDTLDDVDIEDDVVTELEVDTLKIKTNT